MSMPTAYPRLYGSKRVVGSRAQCARHTVTIQGDDGLNRRSREAFGTHSPIEARRSGPGSWSTIAANERDGSVACVFSRAFAGHHPGRRSRRGVSRYGPGNRLADPGPPGAVDGFSVGPCEPQDRVRIRRLRWRAGLAFRSHRVLPRRVWHGLARWPGPPRGHHRLPLVRPHPGRFRRRGDVALPTPTSLTLPTPHGPQACAEAPCTRKSGRRVHERGSAGVRGECREATVAVVRDTGGRDAVQSGRRRFARTLGGSSSALHRRRSEHERAEHLGRALVRRVGVRELFGQVALLNRRAIEEVDAG